MVNNMTRTERLVKILILLTIAFMAYITYLNRANLKENIDNLIHKFKEPEIVVPYDKTVNHLNYNFTTVKETNEFKPYNIEDIKNIYYTVLNNGWEEFTFYCPKEYENCVNDIKQIADGNEYLSLINNYVNPYNAYIKYNSLLINDNEIHLTVNKLYSNEEINEINNKVDTIFEDLKINNTNSQKDNIKKIHNYIINNTKYDDVYRKGDTTVSNKANGVLSTGIALCSGYSDLFSIMLNKLNIPNFRVSNEEHIWNVVYVDNQWSHIDVTWDDDERNINNIYNFYLINTKELLEKDNDMHAFNIDSYLELK